MNSLPPILEFDSDHHAILNPSGKQVDTDGSELAIACFFVDVLDKLAGRGELDQIGTLGSEMGRVPVYRTIDTQSQVLAYLAGQGAPFSVQLLEKMIAAGINKIIAISGCGVLTNEFQPGEIVILQSAVRDEGTSYHYLPPGREVNASPAAVQAVSSVLQVRSIPFQVIKTWSTDAIFRETPARRETRVNEGCRVVEMEAAALYAVAQFRHVEIVQIAYAGDLVIPGRWDKRAWDERFEDRERLFHLAIEALQNWE